MSRRDRNEEDVFPPVLEMGKIAGGYPALYEAALQAGDEAAAEAQLPISQYFGVLRRYRWRIAGFVAVVVLATITITSRLTPIFEATATVDIDRQDRKSTRLNSSH